MSDVGKAEAKAPAPEAVADDKTAVTTDKTETPVEESTEETETEVKTDDAPVEGAEPVETEEEKKTKSKLRRERQQAREASLKQRVEDLEQRLAVSERNKPAPATQEPRPDRSKYDDEAEYAADLAAWKIEEKITARQRQAQEANSTSARSDTAAAKMELFKERAMALTERYPDIEAKVFKDDTLPMSATMAETLMESEKGPEVAYYLSAHREEAQRIKSLSPLQAARELGRIEATLSLPKPRTETKAPPPPSTVNGAVKRPSQKLEDLSMADYKKARGFV